MSSVRFSGSWLPFFPSAKDSGTWKEVQEGLVRDGGTWKRFFILAATYFVQDGSHEDVNPVGGGTTITMTYSANGDLTITGEVSGTLIATTWVSPTSFAPGTTHIRVDVTDGSVSSGTTGSDLALTSNRSWTKAVGDATDETVTMTVTLKDGSGGSTLASASISLRAASL